MIFEFLKNYSNFSTVDDYLKDLAKQNITLENACEELSQGNTVYLMELERLNKQILNTKKELENSKKESHSIQNQLEHKQKNWQQEKTFMLEEIEALRKKHLEEVELRKKAEIKPQEKKLETYGNFILLGDGTVKHKYNNLIWKQTHEPQPMNWHDAFKYIEKINLNYGGKWRLPTRQELEVLVMPHLKPTIENYLFPNTPSACFWTSSTGDSLAGYYAWYVDFSNGVSDTASKEYKKFYVRLVKNS